MPKWLLLLPILLGLGITRVPAEEISLYEYVMTGQQGDEVTLAEYEGRILVVEFFATWCLACQTDLPEIASLQERYSNQQVAFVAISADRPTGTLGRLTGFLSKHPVTIPVLVGGSIFVDRYTGIDKKGERQIVLPQTYVFDGEGEILYRFVGERKHKGKLLIQELDRLLSPESS